MGVPDQEIVHRFSYHPPKDAATASLHQQVRDRHLILALWLTNVLPPSRETSLALTAIQESMMWANAAVAYRGVNDSQELRVE